MVTKGSRRTPRLWGRVPREAKPATAMQVKGRTSQYPFLICGIRRANSSLVTKVTVCHQHVCDFLLSRQSHFQNSPHRGTGTSQMARKIPGRKTKSEDSGCPGQWFSGKQTKAGGLSNWHHSTWCPREGGGCNRALHPHSHPGPETALGSPDGLCVMLGCTLFPRFGPSLGPVPTDGTDVINLQCLFLAFSIALRASYQARHILLFLT